MYILNAKIENIRSIRRFELSFEPEECPGWHVLIGDNGAGTTTIVRALALGLIGHAEALVLRQDWRTWLCHGGKRGYVELSLLGDASVDPPESDGSPTGNKLTSIPVITEAPFQSGKSRPSVVLGYDSGDTYGEFSPDRGWFSASFGPYRRLSGGDPKVDPLFESHPRVAPHLSAFGEDIAFTHIVSWLRDLRFRQLENERSDPARLLNDLRRFINDGRLLPHDTTLQEVTSDEVVFRDGNGCKVDINQLSDGYRSVLSLTFELIRQLLGAYGRKKVFIRDGDSVKPQIEVPGVVIVDEIDAHLHPTWQRRIGRWFTERFPKLQFIVTTHSPWVCQAAERGSVWRLPTPGVEDDGGRITGTELKRLIYGNVLEAYGTEAFGSSVNRSESSKEKMLRLAQLNQKSLRSDLSETEQAELLDLRSTLPTSAGTLDATQGEVH